MTGPNREELRHIGQLIDERKVTVNVQKTLPLAQVSAAQDFLENDHVRGKIVLTVG